MEPLTTTYAKAVDDLSANIFIPALICSVFVEFGPIIQKYSGFGLIPTYLAALVIGALASISIISLILQISISCFKGSDIDPYIGVSLMPLGFAGLFPNQFSELNIPYSQVTGVAMLAWSFMLVKGKRFFYGHFWGDM